MPKEEKENHDEWLKLQQAKELKKAGVAPSSLELVTDDLLFGRGGSVDERLVDAAFRDLEDVDQLPEVGEDVVRGTGGRQEESREKSR